MNSQGRNLKEFHILFTDFLKILKRKRKKILLCSLIMGLIGFFYAINRPMDYFAEAIFREKRKSEVDFQNPIFSMMSGRDGETAVIMKSTPLLEKLILRLNMQAAISENFEFFPWLQQIKNRFLVEHAYFKNLKYPVLPDKTLDIEARSIQYSGETELPIKLEFKDDNFLFLTDSQGRRPVNISEIKGRNYSFEIHKAPNASLAGRAFHILLRPLKHLSKDISKLLVIKADTDDRNIVKISYHESNRHKAAEFVNELMKIYQEYLRDEHEKAAGAQLEYLKKRELEITQSYQKMMQEHAKRIEKDISATGFADSKKELEFFSLQLVKIANRAMKLELDARHYENLIAKAEKIEDLPVKLDSETEKELIRHVRELRMQRDALMLSLSEVERVNGSENFSEHLAEEERIKNCCLEIDFLVEKLKNNESLELAYLQDPRYLAASWNKSLEQKRENFGDFAEFKEKFLHYLLNLKHVLEMQANAIRERLGRNSGSNHSFKGVSLDTAKKIYINLAKDRQENEIAEKQIEFVLKHMERPDFELSSLASLLRDKVSLASLEKASELSFILKETNNRSQKERERIAEDLNIYKEFLKMHLADSKKLLSLKGAGLAKKNEEIQEAMLDSINKELSVYEKQFHEFIAAKLSQMNLENKILKDHQNNLKKELAKTSYRAIDEKILDQQLARNQRMIEQITSMVESKNISSNLELIQSAPIDYAISPLHPRHPRILALTLLGAFLGFTISSLFFIGQGISAETPLTEDNLKLNGYPVLGTFKIKRSKNSLPIYDSNIEIARRIISFLNEKKSLVCLNGKNPPFAYIVADLLRERQKTVLVIDFDELSIGLEQAIRRNEPIQDYIDNDTLSWGGSGRFLYEPLFSAQFENIIADLEKEYDYIIGSSSLAPESPESLRLMEVFDRSVIGLSDRTYQDLHRLFDYEKLNKSAFVFFKILR